MGDDDLEPPVLDAEVVIAAFAALGEEKPSNAAMWLKAAIDGGGWSPGVVAMLRGAYDSLLAGPASPTKDERRARLVAGISKFRGRDDAQREGIVRVLREIEPELWALDEEQIWSAWGEAMALDNEPVWIAASLSLELNIFSYRTHYLMNRQKPRTWHEALQAAAKAVGQADRRVARAQRAGRTRIRSG